MTTPNNQPTPPPGMEILTDYTKPLPEGALYEIENGTWVPSRWVGCIPLRECTYAITHPSTGDAPNEKGGEPRAETPAPPPGMRIWTREEYKTPFPCAPHVFSPPQNKWIESWQHEKGSVVAKNCLHCFFAVPIEEGDTTNEKGGEPCATNASQPSEPCARTQNVQSTVPQSDCVASNAALDVRSVEQRQELQDTESLVCADILERQRKGVLKYGTTVAENPLAPNQWLQHAYEEALDLAIYLKRRLQENQ